MTPIELLERHAHELAEHFDSVQIFATKQKGSTRTTEGFDTGVGCIYSRHAITREWLIIQDQYAAEYAKRKDREE